MTSAAEPTVSVGRAFRLGFAQAVSLWPAAILVFGLRAVQTLAAFALPVALFRSTLTSLRAGLWLWATGSVLVWLLVQVASVIAIGGSLRQGAERMRANAPGSLLSQAAVAAPRGLSYLFWSSLLELIRFAWNLLAFTGAGLSYLRSLIGDGRMISSAALALCVTLSLLTALLATIWFEVAFVRAVIRNQGYLPSLLEAATAMRVRLSAFVWLMLLTGGLAWALNGTLSALFGFTGRVAPAWQLTVAQQISVGVLSAFVATVFELTRLQGIGALTLDVLALAKFKRIAPIEAEPIPVAEVVVPALPAAEPPA